MAGGTVGRDNERGGMGSIQLPVWIIVFATVVIALASLATLAVVAHGRNADALATTALDVALVSFIVQFIIFAAQTTRVEGIYRETTATLVEIREKSTGINDLSNRILDEVRDMARSQIDLTPAAAKDASEIAAAVDKVYQNVIETVRHTINDQIRREPAPSALAPLRRDHSEPVLIGTGRENDPKSIQSRLNALSDAEWRILVAIYDKQHRQITEARAGERRRYVSMPRSPEITTLIAIGFVVAAAFETRDEQAAEEIRVSLSLSGAMAVEILRGRHEEERGPGDGKSD